MCRARAVPNTVDAVDAALVTMQESVELTQDPRRYGPAGHTRAQDGPQSIRLKAAIGGLKMR